MNELSHQTEDDTVIWEAEFNSSVKTYWLLQPVLVCLITVVLIPLIPFVLVIGYLLVDRYLKSHRSTLTSRTLKVSRGILTRQEKTIPLDRITDLGLVQGPLMRLLNIESLSVETAGQSSPGSLVSLTGIRNGRAFRDAVLKQRDMAVTAEAPAALGTSTDAQTGFGSTNAGMETIESTLIEI
ncbi:MAG: PH domain-containing protein, partial [Planctomycetota bacterium]